jgi:hypothetical protein
LLHIFNILIILFSSFLFYFHFFLIILGAFGGQRREDFRTDFDPGRGGYGIAAQQEFLIKR